VTPIWTKIPRVVVGVHDSPAARWALAWAIGEARLRDLPLLVVHAIQPPRSGTRAMAMPSDLALLQRERSDVVRRLLGDMTIPPEVEVTTTCPYGRPGETLTRLARDGDVLVLGGCRRGPLSRVTRGSVPGYCARHANATLVIVPEPSLSSLDHALEEAPSRRRTRRQPRRF
jgi:nucleotide-binding universal stress UspA family protein